MDVEQVPGTRDTGLKARCLHWARFGIGIEVMKWGAERELRSSTQVYRQLSPVSLYRATYVPITQCRAFCYSVAPFLAAYGRLPEWDFLSTLPYQTCLGESALRQMLLQNQIYITGLCLFDMAYPWSVLASASCYPLTYLLSYFSDIW